MEIYCFDCKFTEDYEDRRPPERCPKCGDQNMSVEEDQDLHKLCQIYSKKKGLKYSFNMQLPRLFFYAGNYYEDWLKFKDLMTDFKALGPPPDKRRGLRHYFSQTGVDKELDKGLSDLFGMPFLRRIGNRYTEFWKNN